MNRSDIEMAIVKHLLERAKEFGWVCVKVDNGDGYEHVNDDDEALDTAFAADSAELCFEREGFRQQWVMLVFGNDGWDVIADCSCGLPEWDVVMLDVDNQSRFGWRSK